MSGDAARAIDTEFPNLRPEVVEGYRNAPAHLVAEVIDGELSLLPRPRPRHSRATLRLGAKLAPFDDPQGDDPGGWVILVEPELSLGALPDLVVPDLAGWRRERLPEEVFTDDEVARIDIAPDWACEVLSPSTAKTDRADKLEIYRREGVGHAWLVDPTLRLVEVFRRAAEGWLRVAVLEGDERVRAEPFEAIELELGALWRR